MSKLRDDLATAMKHSVPAHFMRDSVKNLIAAGVSRVSVTAELEQLRKNVSDEEEDVILDTLDFLTGWCHPDLKL